MGLASPFSYEKMPFTKDSKMIVNITCHFCFENFEIFLDNSAIPNTEIFDCEICCNPNKVHYQFQGKQILIFEISNGND